MHTAAGMVMVKGLMGAVSFFRVDLLFWCTVGILDIVDWFRPDVLIGGFHFSKLPLDDTLRTYAQYLDSFPTKAPSSSMVRPKAPRGWFGFA